VLRAWLRKSPILFFGVALGLVAAAGAGGWFATDALERNDDFCNACHLDGWTSGTPLHTTHRSDFDARPAPTLAAAHAAAGLPEREGDPAFHCIDCHSGTGFVGRARVKLLAAKDAVVWLSGDFEEPKGMNWPLLEEDCQKCHMRFETKAGEFEDPAFHDLAVHNAELGVDCVECHLAHPSVAEGAVAADRWFVDSEHVRKQCGRCHSEFLP